MNGAQFVYQGQDPILIESSEPIAYMVMRDRFDQYLLQQARCAGTRYSQWRRGDRRPEESDGVAVVTERGQYCAKIR